MAIVTGDAVASQQVLDIQFLDVGGLDLSLRQIHQAGQRTDADSGGAQPLQHVLAPTPGNRGHGDDDVRHFQSRNERFQPLRRKDGQAENMSALQRRIVVEKADDAHLAATGHHRRQLAARRTRAVDQHVGRFVTRENGAVGTAEPLPRQRARAGHAEKQQQRLDQADRARNAVDAIESEKRGIADTVKQVRAQYGEESTGSGVPEDHPVEAGRNEDRQRHDDRCQHGHPRMRRQIDPVTQAKIISRPDRQYAQTGIDHERGGALDWSRHGERRCRPRLHDHRATTLSGLGPRIACPSQSSRSRSQNQV